MSGIDVLVFAAHPDDAEIGCGGTILKMTDEGRAVVIADLALGELGTRGNAATRAEEAARSSDILALHARQNLELPDGNIHVSGEAKRTVAMSVRRWRPDAVFLPYWEDRHPDHANASRVIYEGTFIAGLARFDTGQQPYRPNRLYYYMSWYEFEPTFIVDISDVVERKMSAIYAYSTQFSPDEVRHPVATEASPTTDWQLRSRMRYYGGKIQRMYGEAFLIRGRLRVDDPLTLHFSSF